MSAIIKIQKGKVSSQEGAFEYLDSKELLFPGSFVTSGKVEEALGIKFSDDKTWEFLGPWLELKAAIMSRGFFITQKGCDGAAFRILESREMAAEGEKRLQRSMIANMACAYILSSHDISALTQDEKKTHKHTQQKCAQSALMQQKIMFTDKVF